ncbi:5'-nucleotidase, lipoprotein e(P4) family [Chitinophagaceae bacterium LWZ2-11]
MNKILGFICLSVLLFACATHKQATVATNQSTLVPDGKLFTSFFQQRAAEYKALCFQAYNIAQLRLDQSLQQQTTKKRAVVTDIDETFLDNSPYAVHQGLQGKDYESATWAEWTSLGRADTLAGALTFFKYAASQNVEVFYITNRDEKERPGTLKNLQHYGFPFADNEHLIMRQTTSSKETRRQTVSADHDIVLLLGDNLGDFSALFDKKTEDERTKNVQQNAGLFGSKFIVLPNANYGDWEGAFYQYNYKLSPAQKDSLIRKALILY